MEESLRYKSFDVREKQIKITDTQITYDDKTIVLNDVLSLRYNTEHIEFDMFSVGTKYNINISTEHDEINIIFKSYFGFSNSYFYKHYVNIVNKIWESAGDRLIDEAIEQIKQGKTITVGKCVISKEGISFKKQLTEWQDLSYQKNYDRITLNNHRNYKIWTNLYYRETPNFDILVCILDWIYKHDGLEEIKNSLPQ